MTTNTPESVEALKARVAELEGAAARRRVTGRGVSAWVVLVVAALLFPLALTAFWAQRTLTDTERYVATVAPLSQDPTIQKAIGDTVTSALVAQLDTENRVSDLLSGTQKLQPLAGPIALGVNTFIGREVDQILASDAFDGLWAAINRGAQTALVKALEGRDNGAVSVQGDQVVLDTGELIAQVKQRLVDRGLTFAANVPVPAAADREVVLLTSPELARAQSLYALAQPLAQWLIYATAALFVGAVLLARRRARMTIAAGVAIILGALVLRFGLMIGQQEISLSLQGTPFAAAEEAFFTILTTFLHEAVRSAFVIGILIAALGWFLSGSSAAVRSREVITDTFSGVGGRAVESPIGPFAAWVARTRTFWRVAIAVIAIAILTVADTISAALITSTVIVAVIALAVVQFLASAGSARKSANPPA